MYTTQISHALPKEKWQSVTIIENNDPIVLISATSKITLANPEIKVRRYLIEMLNSASKHLPENYTLHIIEGVKSLEKQQKSWDASYKKIQNEFPNKDNDFYEKQTGLLVARPLPLANHNCGGAVDVHLQYNGEFVDMGTLPQSGFNYSLTQMFSKDITEEQMNNRTILRVAMEKAGFVWYPGEWWHYCYGDRMWAVYTNRTECCYGPIQDINDVISHPAPSLGLNP